MAAPFLAGKEKSNRTILLEFQDIRKITSIDATSYTSKQKLIQNVFGVAVANNLYLSLQRFDENWGEYVDVEITEIMDRDKVKVKVIESANTITNSEDGNGSAGENAVDRLLQNLESDREALDYRLNVAMATLSSMKEKPRPRNPIGTNTSFTCSTCHFRGHRANMCRSMSSCQGYFECGVPSLHKEYRGELKEAENEVKEVQKLIKSNIEEVEKTKLLKERTRTNFFAAMRKRLQSTNPIKYSSRVVLDNDLRILAVACKHKVPSPSINNLEEIIEKQKRNATSYQWRAPRNEPSFNNFKEIGENQKSNSASYQWTPPRNRPSTFVEMTNNDSNRDGLHVRSYEQTPLDNWNFRNNRGGQYDDNGYRGTHAWSPIRGQSPMANYSNRTGRWSPRGQSPVANYPGWSPRVHSPMANPSVTVRAPYNKSFYGPVMYHSTVSSVHSPVYQSSPYQSARPFQYSDSQKMQPPRQATKTHTSTAESDIYQHGDAKSFSRKRLNYHEPSSQCNKENKAAKRRTAEELGRQFRESLNKSVQKKTNGPKIKEQIDLSSSGNLLAYPTLGSDEETQDFDSPAKHQSNSPLLMTTERKGQESSLQEAAAEKMHDEEESQAFDFDNWAANQKEISKKLSTDPTSDNK